MEPEEIVDDDGVDPIDDEDLDEKLYEKLGDILTRSAIELKGPPPPLTWWSWHDIPDLIRELKRERDAYLGMVECCRELVAEVGEGDALAADLADIVGWPKKGE